MNKSVALPLARADEKLTGDTNAAFAGEKVKSTLVSYYANLHDNKPDRNLTLAEVFDEITSPVHALQIDKVREAYAANMLERGNALKKLLPVVTFGGVFSGRGAKTILSRSNLCVIDLDDVDAPSGKVRLFNRDPHVVMAFVSPSGTGVKLVFVNHPEAEHADVFRSAAEYLKTKYNLKVDESGKDISRLCFMSYDPEAFFNPQATALPHVAPECKTDVASQQIEVQNELDVRFGPLVIPGKKEGVPGGINTQRLAAEFARRNLILWSPSVGKFYAYQDSTGLWVVQSLEQVRLSIGGLVLELARPLESEFPGIVDMVTKLRSDDWTRGVANQLRAIVEESDPFTNRHQGYIHVANGMVKIDPLQLEGFKPEYRSLCTSPITYDPKADCPMFLNYLLGPAMKQEDRELLQLYAGQCLLGRNLSQRILLIIGTAGGGKSSVVTIIEKLVGMSNFSELRTRHLAERFELYRYLGRSLLSGKDVPGDFLQSEGAHMLKALTGGDALEPERKGSSDSFRITGEFNVVITSNSNLRVRLDGDAEAWRRRLMLIRYEAPKTDNPIPDFPGVLFRTEGPGILNWAIEGARKLHAANYQFRLTANQQELVDSLLEQSDPIRFFVRSTLTPSQGDDVTVAEANAAYVQFCDSRGWDPMPTRRFETLLPDAVIGIHRIPKSNSVQRSGKAQRGFRNLKIVGEV